MPDPTPTRVRDGWRIRGMTLADRLAYHTEPEPMSGCWVWVGARNPKGYGRVFANGKMEQAHRVVYELLVGPIPVGLTLDHHCRLRCCVNPGHVEPVSNKENLRRGVGFPGENARKTHCPKGHTYTLENTAVVRVGIKTNRHCRTCLRELYRRYNRTRPNRLSGRDYRTLRVAG